MIYLKEIELKSGRSRPNTFPFNLRLIQTLKKIVIREPVSIFAGENGSGKSTLLEGIAAGIRSTVVGGRSVERDDSLKPARAFAKFLRFTWSKRTHRGFFLRAEDFFNYARKTGEMVKEMDRDIADYEKKFKGYALLLTKGSAQAQRKAMVDRYGENLDARSHGESFLTLFKQRLVPGGLYLLDEPEVPLSPQRQLTLLSMIKEGVEKNESQFIIATHSPILMALPGAVILNFDEYPLKQITYEETEHYNLTRRFLNDPGMFLRHL